MGANNTDRSTIAMMGGILMGLGIGFYFLNITRLEFVGYILTGLGLGLIIMSIISTRR